VVVDLPLDVELGLEIEFETADDSLASPLCFSNEEGDGSAEVTGVKGFEHPMGESLPLGGVEGSELSSLAPSPCL
jgi:hypothetical protein